MDKVQALRGAEDAVSMRWSRRSVLLTRMIPVLVAGDMAGNAEKIAEVIGRDNAHVKALVASGGYCAPLESRYDVFGIGTTDRP